MKSVAQALGLVVMYANIYRAGVYHRQGKPLTTDLHLGDLYTSEANALADIAPPEEASYVATVPVLVPQAVASMPEAQENGYGSVPIPLNVTRKLHKQNVARGASEQQVVVDQKFLTEPTAAWPGAAVHGLEGVFQGGEPHFAVPKAGYGTSKGYKPTHGGYPG